MGRNGTVGSAPKGCIDLYRLESSRVNDFVFTEFVGRGTHSGTFASPGGPSIPATGKKGELPCCEAFRLRDGKVVSGRIYYDMLTLLGQLGVAPGLPTERPAETPAPEPPLP